MPTAAGIRDRAPFLVVFVAALRRSELFTFDAEHLTEHTPRDRDCAAPLQDQSTRQTSEFVVLLCAGAMDLCAIAALRTGSMSPTTAESHPYRAMRKLGSPSARGALAR
jgi:hypothetical protein